MSATERRRLAAHAKKRRLKVATAARVFLEEHLSELEDRAELSAAEEWQRAQAWATWEKIKAGDVPEVTLGRNPAEKRDRHRHDLGVDDGDLEAVHRLCADPRGLYRRRQLCPKVDGDASFVVLRQSPVNIRELTW